LVSRRVVDVGQGHKVRFDGGGVGLFEAR
jgi:hypothetical protein